MQIAWGKTRFVILTGNVAIKFAKIRILRLLGRAIVFPFTSQRNRDRFYKAYGKPFRAGIWNYIMIGIGPNREEFRYYQKYKDDRVVATMTMYFFGWVIIQKRGQRISAQELECEGPFRHLQTNGEFLETNQPWQFCRINGKVLLADYGREETRQALRQTLNITTE